MAKRRINGGALILAAGRSTRFGGEAKALASFGGRTLLRAAVENFRALGLTRILVVTGHAGREVAAVADALKVETVHNHDYDQGLFSSLKAGLTRLEGTDVFFVQPVDGALVLPQTILSLLTVWREKRPGRNKTLAVVPTFLKQPGHPPLINARYRQEILNYSGPDGLQGWLGSRQADGPVIYLERPDEGIGCDINTPDDLAAVRLSKGTSLPTPAEAWRLLLQSGLPREKLRHSVAVAAGALRLSLALTARGLAADSRLALTGGLLHDIARQEKKHAQAGRRLAETFGWPHLALVIGAHTDPPEELLIRLGLDASGATGDPAFAQTSEPVLRAALAVYMADKYWWEDQPVDLKTRFQKARDLFSGRQQAQNTVDRREQTALKAEQWLQNHLGTTPESIIRQPSTDSGEAELASLRPRFLT